MASHYTKHGVTTPAQMLKRLEQFPWDDWNKSLAAGLTQPYRDIVYATITAAAKTLGADANLADSMLARFMTSYVTERVVQLNTTTRESVKDLIRGVIAGEVDTDVRLGELVLDRVRETYDGYEVWRAERIARTETAIAYNQGGMLGYSQAGVEEVEVMDGTGDEACADANGQTWTLREAMADPIAHPNCGRSFLPIVPEAESRGAIERLALDDDLALVCAIAAEMAAERDDPCATRVLDDITDEDET